jgi:hypothetical protein
METSVHLEIWIVLFLHTGDPVRCTEVLTVIENRCAEVSNATDQCVNTFEHI